MKRETFVNKVRLSAKCLDGFAHHEWIDSEEITIRGQKYTGLLCSCGQVEVIREQ